MSREQSIYTDIEAKMGVADLDDDELELEPRRTRKFTESDNNSESESDSSSDDEVTVENDSPETIITPVANVLTTSSSNTVRPVTTPSTTADAIVYKRVGVTEDQARNQSMAYL